MTEKEGRETAKMNSTDENEGKHQTRESKCKNQSKTQGWRLIKIFGGEEKDQVEGSLKGKEGTLPRIY